MDEKRLKRLAAARESAIQNGMINFRLSAELMRELFKLADEKGMGPSTLAKEWVVDSIVDERSNPHE